MFRYTVKLFNAVSTTSKCIVVVEFVIHIVDFSFFSLECKHLKEESCPECVYGSTENQTCAREMLRLLAEISFINAEVCVC